MKKYLYILSLCFAVLGAAACSSDEDTIIPDQRTAFERYITSKNLDYTENGGVYQCVLNADRADYETAAKVKYGAEVSIWFTVYTFSGSSFNESAPIYSTSPEVIAELKDKYPDRNFDWPEGPSAVTIGQTKMIKGLENGLVGLREGDEALLLITSNLAFGGEQLGAVGEDTPMVYKVYISEIINQ